MCRFPSPAWPKYCRRKDVYKRQRIDIADTGIGIPEGEYHQVFQRFYRSQAVADQEGVGLGLYLSLIHI